MTKKKAESSFDASKIPSYVQYDVIPLPSNGECYPHKISRVPVAYLTAADENIITAPNLYRDGKVIDTILSRKILDDRIKPDELTKGDRDAIVLWLRSTGYSVDFPIVAINPNNGKEIKSSVDLSTLKYRPFDLEGDENGHFTYKCEDGDVIMFKYLSKKEEDDFLNENAEDSLTSDKLELTRSARKMAETLKHHNIDKEHSELLTQYLDDMVKIVNDIKASGNDAEEKISPFITNRMSSVVVSVNGNEDREFIQNYIENLRIKESKRFREFVQEHTPGVDLEIDVEIPESDGGGSFKTFLTLGETCFINL